MLNGSLNGDEHIKLDAAADALSWDFNLKIWRGLLEARPKECTCAIDFTHVFCFSLFDEAGNLPVLLPKVNGELYGIRSCHRFVNCDAIIL